MLLVRVVRSLTGGIRSRLARGDRHPETAESLHGSLGRATRLPHGACRRPQPVAASKRFRFWPVAISNPWMLAFARPRKPSQSKPCHSLTALIAAAWQCSISSREDDFVLLGPGQDDAIVFIASRRCGGPRATC